MFAIFSEANCKLIFRHISSYPHKDFCTAILADDEYINKVTRKFDKAITNFQQKAKAWGLSEKDALDVFYHGEEIKPGMKVRTYNGYELYIYYGKSKTTGQPYISTIWKRKRQ